ncbi:hypothetical protein CVT26_009332 [Gymnopilus dilepis]|uniref:Uncharacterized protein n=1 Tax=Gymnopilus dilepis TaxID=231916 RepID=A0A409YA52_9AGAR|nr:hypothetical protein CVT26_009332 [Gymnopilus dilepis]
MPVGGERRRPVDWVGVGETFLLFSFSSLALACFPQGKTEVSKMAGITASDFIYSYNNSVSSSNSTHYRERHAPNAFLSSVSRTDMIHVTGLFLKSANRTLVFYASVRVSLQYESPEMSSCEGP